MTSKAPACTRGKESKAMNRGETAWGVETTPFQLNYISKSDTAQNPQENAWHEGHLGVPVRCCYSAEGVSIQRVERQEKKKKPFLVTTLEPTLWFSGLQERAKRSWRALFPQASPSPTDTVFPTARQCPTRTGPPFTVGTYDSMFLSPRRIGRSESRYCLNGSCSYPARYHGTSCMQLLQHLLLFCL